MLAILFLLLNTVTITLGDKTSFTDRDGTGWIDSLIQYAFDMRHDDPKLAMSSAEKADQLAIGQNNINKQHWASAIQVILHANRDEDTIAIRKINELGDVEDLENGGSMVGYVLLAAGKVYYNVGLEEKARDYVTKTIDQLQKVGSPSNITNAMLNTVLNWRNEVFIQRDWINLNKPMRLH